VEHKLKTIKSFSNPIYKELKKLTDTKKRKSLKKFLIEGYTFLKDAIQSSTLYPMELLVVSEDILEKPKIAKLLTQAIEKCINCIVLSQELYDSLNLLKTPQGVLGIFKERNFDFVRLNLRNFVVILDEIRDPSNVGAIIRSACAFGASAVFFSKATADPFSLKSVRASAGTLLFIPIVKVEDWSELISFLKQKNYKVVATSLTAKISLRDARLSTKSAIVLGNEAGGITSFWDSFADLKIKIPISRKVESLNVAVAGGIIFYTISTF